MSEFSRQSEYQASIGAHGDIMVGEPSIGAHDHTTTNEPFIGAHDHTTTNEPSIATHAPDCRGFTFIGAKERITSDGRRIMDMPATKELFKPVNAPVTNRLRVAAYARVSTDDEEQQTSYAAQVDHYTRFITSNPEWEFLGLYADADAPYGLYPNCP